MLVLTLVAIDDGGSSCDVVAVYQTSGKQRQLVMIVMMIVNCDTNLLPFLPLLLLCLYCHCSCLMVQNCSFVK